MGTARAEGALNSPVTDLRSSLAPDALSPNLPRRSCGFHGTRGQTIVSSNNEGHTTRSHTLERHHATESLHRVRLAVVSLERASGPHFLSALH